MKRTIYRIILVSAFLIAIFTIKSYGASDFTYELVGDEAIITGYNGADSNIVIPSEIDGHKVVSIKYHAFDGTRTNGNSLVNVTISEGITKIESFAFMACKNLETVTLPNSISTIEMQAFIDCTNLKSINIPTSLSTITSYCFAETGLEEITIPSNVEKIESGAFNNCILKKVTVYSNNLDYYYIVPSVYNGDGTVEYNVRTDSKPFGNYSDDLVIYGYAGSTTQEYAQQNGMHFELILDGGNENPTTNSVIENETEEPTNNNEIENLINNELNNSIENNEIEERNIIQSSSNDDNTVAEEDIPYTGVRNFILIMFASSFIVAVVSYIYYKRLKLI